MDYVRLSEIPVKHDWLGCSVEILHIILLRKTSSGKVIAQLQFRNISKFSVKSLYVSIRCRNEMGDILNNGAPLEFVYQDLNVRYGEKFGDRIPVPIPDEHTRNIDVCVEKYLLSDGSIHDKSEFEKVDLPKSGQPIPRVLLEVFEQEEQSQQYKTQFPKAIYPHIEENGWVCSCGKFNRTDMCSRCRLDRGQLSVITPEKLEECFKKNVEEKRKAEAAERAKRRKINTRIGIVSGTAAALAIVALVVTKWLIPDVIIPKINADKYEQANSLEEAGELDSAYDLFVELGDYADSTERLVNIENNKQYINGCELLESEKYQEAHDIFVALVNYKDSELKAREAYEHIKSGIFSETRTITVGTDFYNSSLYSPSRSKTENVVCKMSVSYSNGIPNMDNVMIEFTGHILVGATKWNEFKYKYIGEFDDDSFTGDGKLYKVYSGKDTLIYSGGFEDGAFSGRGEFYYPNSEQVMISGVWKNGNINGDYTMYYSGGAVKDKGYVENGVVYSDKFGEEDNSALMPKTWPNSVNQ